jgi:hypothetical protein
VGGHNRGNGLWIDPTVPKRGWTCVHVFDLGWGEYQTCEMCQSALIRYVHHMQHPEYPDLETGCICAGAMSGDPEGSRSRERDVRNRSARRRKWLSRKWRRSANGNPTLRVDGYFATVFPRGARWGWLIVRRYDDRKRFSSSLYVSEGEAKLALFDELEKLGEE